MSSTNAPTIESLIGSRTIGETRIARLRDIRSGMPCLSMNDSGDLCRLSSCPPKWRWAPRMPRGRLKPHVSRSIGLVYAAIRVLSLALPKLIVGVLLGAALVSASVVVAVGISHLSGVRWQLIAEALDGRGREEVDPQAHRRASHTTNPAPSRPSTGSTSPSGPDLPRGGASSSGLAADLTAERSSLPPMPPDGLSVPPLPRVAPSLSVNWHATVDASPRQEENNKGQVASDAHLNAGVAVNLLPGPAVQPDIGAQPQGGVQVHLMPPLAVAASSPGASGKQEVPKASSAPADWSVVTVVGHGVVVRQSGQMKTVEVGNALPDGRILHAVDPSSGSWVAVNPTPIASSSQPQPQPQQEQTHGHTTRLPS